MTKMNKFIPLFVLPLLLTACGNSNKVFKPSFEKYGEKMSQEAFDQELHDKCIEARGVFFEDYINGIFLDNDYVVDFRYGKEISYKEKNSNNNEYTFLDVKNTLKIDNDNKRSEGTIVVKSVVKGNLSEDHPHYHPVGKATGSDNYYAELKEDTFYYTSSYKKEYKHHTIPSASLFAYNSIIACIDTVGKVAMDRAFNAYTNPGYDSSEFYKNNNVYTYVRAKNLNGYTKEIMQWKYESDSCSFKHWFEGKYEDDECEEPEKEGNDFSIRKADVTVNEFDYSSYTDATLMF